MAIDVSQYYTLLVLDKSTMRVDTIQYIFNFNFANIHFGDFHLQIISDLEVQLRLSYLTAN